MNDAPITGNNMKIALLQIHIDAGNPEANFKKVEEKLLEAVSDAANKPDVILLPEMWNTGYALDRIHELADTKGQRTKRLMADFASKHHVNIVAGSIADKTGDQVRNTIYAFDRSGEQTADYTKMHLFRLMDEEKHLTAGDRVGHFQLEDAEAGMMICYDIRFPELSRKLALAGAKVLFVPAEWPKPRLNHWRTLLTARAIENQMYVVACNRVGISGDTEFFGHSMIIDPWGEILAEGGEEEAVLRGEIDLALVEQVRNRIPVFEDRRPQLY